MPIRSLFDAMSHSPYKRLQNTHKLIYDAVQQALKVFCKILVKTLVPLKIEIIGFGR